MNWQEFRRDKLTRSIHKWAKGALPTLSPTESEALTAGEVWWDAELFSGNPDWEKLLAVKPPRLSAEEQAFFDGPVREFCAMVDDWEINQRRGDLSEEAWEFLRRNKFFGMIIPKAYGGLAFSAYGHSEVIRLVSTRSVSAAVTVMVPNSLGPGELLIKFGTDAQKDYWLPRLADGRELPAFGLTSDKAGSDASAMVDSGIVCKGEWQGEETLGIRLNWSKRYITLSPVCTVLGLAFKLYDPDHLIGETEAIGITCALVPTDLPGVEIGRRHVPCGQMFQNGPTTGEDVFIPLDHIIGGADYAGKGWMMLMSALAAGRGISLPSLSAAATVFAAHTTGAYSRVREQFDIPIGRFGGVQRRLGRLAADAYVLDAARRLTCAGLDEGRALAVISGIMKSNATYRMREAVNDAMDVHSGKAVIDGPKNYLSAIYKSVPIGITVEGANILTRNMIIFGQGSIRCHPHLLDEMMALQEKDPEKSLSLFDKAFWAHVGHTTKTLLRAWGRAWTGGVFAPAPQAGRAKPIYREMGRFAAAFALTADMAFLTLGGSLKRREMLSARMGDVLSELYLLSAALKRWEDEGRQPDDLPLLEYAAADSFAKIRGSLDAVLVNMPNRFAAGLLRFLTLPGGSNLGPTDKLTKRCADIVYTPSEARDRLTVDLFEGLEGDAVWHLNRAYRKVTALEPLRRKLRNAGRSLDEALADGSLDSEEKAMIEGAEAAVAEVIAVDDFTPEDFAYWFTAGDDRPERREAAE